jgi:archaellum biogenesis ATPase FlaH
MSLTKEQYNDRKVGKDESSRKWNDEIAFVLANKFTYLADTIFKKFKDNEELFSTSLLSVLASINKEENLFEELMTVLEIKGSLEERIFQYLSNVAVKDSETEYFTTLDKIEQTEIDWLAKGFIPYGYCTLVVGKGEQGKSTFLAEILANCSFGGEVFGQKVAEQKVMYISAEETSSNIFLPKMAQANANLKGVHTLIDVNLPQFPESLNYVATYIYENDIKVVVVDPILSMMSGDMMKETDVRKTMHALYSVAQTLDVAVIVVTHTGKSRYADPVHNALGSQGFTATARQVMYVAQDKETEKRYCSVVKSNLTPKKLSWEFEFITVPDSDVAKVIHHGLTDVKSYELNSSEDGIQDIFEQDIYEELYSRPEWETNAMKEFFKNHELATSSMRSFEEARANLVKQGKIKRRKASDRKVFYSVVKEEPVKSVNL